MVTAAAFAALARSLEGTGEAPHFRRIAFRVNRIYATLDPDATSAHLKLTPEEQEFRCMMNPAAFAPVANAWGRQGWTAVRLGAIDTEELEGALQAAWRLALPKPGRRR